MAASALNNASDNSVLSGPANDKVAADGTGRVSQVPNWQVDSLLQALFSSTLGFPLSKTRSEVVSVMLRDGSGKSTKLKVV